MDLPDLINRAQAKADNAYLLYINQSRQDECLGWEIKTDTGKFGRRELDAHTLRGEFLGMHRAYTEVVKMLREATPPESLNLTAA